MFKLKKIIIILLTFFLFNITYWYQINNYLFTQWFSNIQKTNSWLDFVCHKQCILWLWYLKNNKKLLIKWNFNWYWKWILVYVIWKQVIPFKQFNIKNINNPMLLVNNSIYNKLPKNKTIVWIVFNWNINWKNIIFDLSTLTFGEKLSLAWKNFSHIEWITPYIINLKYGFKIFNVQAEKFLTILWFILIVFLILWWIYKNRKVLDIIVYVSIFLTAIISFKNLYEYYIDTKDNIINFNKWDNVFYLNDYYSFIKNIRNHLDFNNNCTYDFILFRSWPFKKRSKDIYFKPCILNKLNPIYVIIYHSNIPSKYQNCEKEYQNWNNLLLKCK